MTVRTCASPDAFKQAFEQRLRAAAVSGAAFARAPYEAIVRENALAWVTLEDVTAATRAVLDPVLTGGLDAEGQPSAWRWQAHRSDAR